MKNQYKENEQRMIELEIEFESLKGQDIQRSQHSYMRLAIQNELKVKKAKTLREEKLQ